MMKSKIENLLAHAAAQADSSDSEQSSVESAARSFADFSEAEETFSRLREKLFRIEKWNPESGFSSFKLFDARGKALGDKAATVGDFVEITLPGSGKSDWVKITDINDAPDEIVLTVQPSLNPTEKPADKNTTSHFFTPDSTNNFCLQQHENRLNFYVIGLGEKSNTGDTKNALESLRNLATANLGRYLGIQKAQWKTFCENFLESEPKD